MNATLRERAAALRQAISGAARPSPAGFRAALDSVPFADRDAWVDAVLGLTSIPDDGPDLPSGCVPYLPCPVAAVQEAVDVARITAADVVVDVGAGVGRAAALLHLLTGARVIGLEVQRELVEAARSLEFLHPAVAIIHGDATALEALAPGGTLYFLYCPFSGARLARLLDELEPLALRRPLRLACVDLPLPPRPWLTPVDGASGAVTVFTSAASS
ncbi:MAG: hypothetical protein JNJ54_29380 [Myxococcaceae bacterium]|nr:hypothetical protein [Myxococcaceae bacterium]